MNICRLLLILCPMLVVMFSWFSPVPKEDSSAGGKPSISSAASVRLDEEIVSLCDYYNFAIKKKRAEIGACISVSLRGDGETRTVCIQGNSNPHVTRIEKHRSSVWATIVVDDDVIVNNSWKSLTDWRMVTSGRVTLSSYVNVVKFGAMFNFGEDTWQRYVEARSGTHSNDSHTEKSEKKARNKERVEKKRIVNNLEL